MHQWWTTRAPTEWITSYRTTEERHTPTLTFLYSFINVKPNYLQSGIVVRCGALASGSEGKEETSWVQQMVGGADEITGGIRV
ncbi:hypothetical protein Hamer_G021339 [Homarus americanus]|uniref:Uncharacterized protein n=1 Tax=Homarus americanus TaxID=6706 RepID=A0A8J5JGR4_HOMAM|nr:hypothetical protein Hamer_G021339 [Homarus americanus]